MSLSIVNKMTLILISSLNSLAQMRLNRLTNIIKRCSHMPFLRCHNPRDSEALPLFVLITVTTPHPDFQTAPSAIIVLVLLRKYPTENNKHVDYMRYENSSSH